MTGSTFFRHKTLFTFTGHEGSRNQRSSQIDSLQIITFLLSVEEKEGEFLMMNLCHVESVITAGVPGMLNSSSREER